LTAYQKLTCPLKFLLLPISGIDKMYLIIKFTQTTQQNEFFHQYRKNIQPLSTLGFKETSKIFINEVLIADPKAHFFGQLEILKLKTILNMCGLRTSKSTYERTQNLMQFKLTLRKTWRLLVLVQISKC